MPDEPRGWELQRAMEQTRKEIGDGFRDLNSRLDKLVTADTFDRERARVDEKFRNFAEDLATEKLERKEGDAQQQKLLDKMTATQRWVIAAIVLPIALFVTTLLMQARGA